MYKNYPYMLALLISIGVIVGMAMQIKQVKEVERNISISTPTGNHSFDYDRELIEFLEGF